MHFLDELKWRGLLQDFSDEEGLRKIGPKTVCYVGFDPTAAALQVGNLVPLTLAIRLGRAGLKPLILFGGATGAIGDPSGKSVERPLLDRETIDGYIASQKTKADEIAKRAGVELEYVNNLEWTRDVTLIEFLREVGKFFTVNYMTAKEVVKARLKGEGISYTEFSYMLLQANDFHHLHQTRNCILQFGGSDQWGNMTAGLELIRKKAQGDAHAFSFPLITNSQGKKFGKSEGDAVWLEASMTSPFKLHQFFLNVPDEDVVNYLKVFTFVTEDRIEELESAVSENPQDREAQKVLADEVCTLVHGEQATDDAKRGADVLFGGALDGLSESVLEDIFSDVPSTSLTKEKISDLTFLDLLVETESVSSRGEGKKLIKNGGAYLNNQRVTDINLSISETPAFSSRIFLLRTGKKSYHVVKIT